MAIATSEDRPRYVQIEGAPAESDRDTERQCRVAMVDITERKKAEAMTRRLASFPELNPNPILEVNGSGEVTFYNPATLAVLTRLGLNEGDCSAFVPGDLQTILAAWDRHTEVMLNREVPIGDMVFDEAIHLVPQFNVVRIYGRDITGRKKAEEALNEANRRLIEAKSEVDHIVEERTAELTKAYESLRVETEERRRAEAELRQAQKVEALGIMSGGIAHDFNNILAAIIGFTELVANHATKGSRDDHYLARVMEAAIRGRELVRQMLTFSRQAEQEKKPLRLSDVVKETVWLIRATTPTTISIRVKTLSESGLILGDPTQMQQVLMNLCTNATHAMRGKGGFLDVELGDFSVPPSNGGNPYRIKPGLYMKLTVRDTGYGIAPDIMEKIFDPFFTTKKPGEGTGLGLSVVHGIVKGSSGYITVESEQDRGSAFTVCFPMISKEPETDAISDDVLPTGSERILFVDDEEALAEMGEEMLAELGYEVTSRMNCREALALFRLNPSRFDLVITDQTMPEMTGAELAREILTLRADMPIIMCTGFSDLVDARKAQAVGIKAFAMKPLTRREIATTIRKVLDE